MGCQRTRDIRRAAIGADLESGGFIGEKWPAGAARDGEGFLS